MAIRRRRVGIKAAQQAGSTPARFRLFKRARTGRGWFPRPRLPHRWRRRKARPLGHGQQFRFKGLWRFAMPLLGLLKRSRMPAAATVPPRPIEPTLAPLRFNDFVVRLAASPEDVDAAQALRYRVFYDEMGASPSPDARAAHRDVDAFDAFCDHLLVIDKEKSNGGSEAIVGTYRLLRRSVAARHRGFYSAGEFDLSRLESLSAEIVELGRSCVDPAYRSRGVMQLLWRGLAAYVHAYDIHLMFGCASFPGTVPAAIGRELSYLHHYHLAPVSLRPRALPKLYVPMAVMPRSAIDVQAAINELPPLIKGYLRVGGFVGDGAVVDHQFNTIDVCIIVRTDQLTAKYERRYRRQEQRPAGRA
jgi:putative hemolysin